MKTFINNESGYPILEVEMMQSDQLKIETGSMIYKDVAIDLTAKTNGGILGGLAKSILGGENFFVTTATCNGKVGRLGLAPKGMGSIIEVDFNESNWYLEDGAFLASTLDVELAVKRQKGIGNVFLGGTGGLFILHATGYGQLFLESFGGLKEVYLDGTQDFLVDNNHVVAWQDTLSHSISVSSGTFGFKTGEGLGITFKGRGKVIIQTRQPQQFAARLAPFLPSQAST